MVTCTWESRTLVLTMITLFRILVKQLYFCQVRVTCQLDYQKCFSSNFRILFFTISSYWFSWRHHFECFTIATMTLLTVTENMCLKWSPRICSSCHEHFLVLFSFMTCHLVCNKSSTTVVTCGEGFILVFLWVSCCSIFSFLCNVL